MHRAHRQTYRRTAYPTNRPAPPAAATLLMALAPLAAMYLLAHPAVLATIVVATTVATAARHRA